MPDGAVDADPATSPVCLDAASHSDLAWIQANVFSRQCVFSGCHDGGSIAARGNLSAGYAYASLINVPYSYENARLLVVPGDTARSYLLVLIGQLEPTQADPPAVSISAEVGVQPYGSVPICAQKRDAIQRWIAQGALNN